MRVGLVTTTINIPEVLRLYRALDDRMQVAIPVSEKTKFFIALDKNSPFSDLAKWGNDPLYSWLTPDYQKKWKCSELIGWKNIQRRNAATLEALEWGADIIVMVDDDNSPLGDYFLDVRVKLLNAFNGLRAEPRDGWFNPYDFTVPPTVHRGLPWQMSHKRDTTLGYVSDAKVGVAAGICLGDPDVDAYTRMATGPTVMSMTDPLHAGIVVDPRETKTVFNSQNTSFLRELSPAMFMLPGCGRHDDILASLICQRVMRERGLHVHFGLPTVWQKRNPHNLMKDLHAELLGMEHVLEFAEWLDGLCLASSVLGDVRAIFTLMNALPWMPAQAIEAGLAWCDDCEAVMS
jgi:hypothetical protein